MHKLRKHKERLLGRSRDDQANDSDDDDLSYNLPQADPTAFAENLDNRWPVDPNQKRASEPYTRYHAAQKDMFDEQDLPERRISNADSRFVQLRSGGSFPKTTTTTSAINPLGLTLVYSFPNPALDIIFIHGLGGTSTQTWSWDRNPENFWLPWLQDDTEIARARIFTYGYDANFKGQYITSTILDFAKDLLLRMRTFVLDVEQHEIAIGRLPIVLVAHSMGGLVSKKAYIIGLNDPQYRDIAEAIFAMIFLATPHRGSQDANTLNNILKVTPGGAKAYVTELAKNSFTLQDISEQFRNIVEKDSAILGYPGEMSDHLVVDHHGMTKFRSPLDTNYTNVKNLLRWLMRQLDIPSYLSPSQNLAVRRSSMPPSPTPIRDEETSDFSRRESIATETPLKQVTSYLAISEAAENDLELLLSNHCSYHWLFQRSAFQSWAADNPDAPNVLWLTGIPGSGKTHLASFIIRWLRTRPFIGTCQFHFYLIGHQGKRTLSYLLRSLALQIAIIDDEFCLRLLELCADSGINLSQQKATNVWDKVFEGILFRLPPRDTFFWVIDGLDEADTPAELKRFLSKIRSATRIKVLITSRATKELAKEITDLPSIAHETISTKDTVQDIQSFVRDSLQKMSLDDTSRSQVIQEILLKASGSFLWVNLALRKIIDNWYTKDDIKSALTEIPAGMEPLYARMIKSIADQSPKLREMATRILAWVATSFRPLNVSELEVALAPQFRDFTNLSKLIAEVCGEFVTVQTASINLIHQTARQFLLRRTANLAIKIDEHEAHKHAATICIEFLSEHDKWKRTFSTIQDARHTKRATTDSLFSRHPFLLYALSFWAYHVSLASTDSDDFITTVLAFLEDNCLLWIHGAALTKDLRIITRTAQYLKTYVKRRELILSKQAPISFAIARDEELRSLANDLIRVVGRFGIYLAESPSSIYKHVVPFCPHDSIIRKSFPDLGQSSFTVTGISSAGWDDCLARLTMGDYLTASKLLCKDNYFVTLVGIDGTLVVWHSETCDEARRITHGEYVTHMASSKTSNLVATAGAKTTKIWDITSGNMIGSLMKNPHLRTKSLTFGDLDDEILVAYDNGYVQCFEMSSGKESWSFLAKDPTSQDHSCARMISFSPDLSQIAIVFRGRPV
ncbi:hypothetical protein MMC17_007520 [Xylographa soralifera]|nr:hypothetical protein [Xylographa soralifera]